MWKFNLSAFLAVYKDHDGSILDDILGFICKYQESPGNGILKYILGEKRNAVEKKMSKI